MFQIFYTLLTSLNVHISRGLEGSQSLNLAESAQQVRSAQQRTIGAELLLGNVRTFDLDSINEAAVAKLLIAIENASVKWN